MINKKRKGFTLIELLVVIAVIGILATLVLISLGGAQDSAKDARMLSSLSQLRTVAAMDAAPLGNYSNACDAITVSAAWKDLDTTANGGMGGKDRACYSEEDGYCIQVTLNSEVTVCTSGDEIKEPGTCSGTGNIVCD